MAVSETHHRTICLTKQISH